MHCPPSLTHSPQSPTDVRLSLNASVFWNPASPAPCEDSPISYRMQTARPRGVPPEAREARRGRPRVHIGAADRWRGSKSGNQVAVKWRSCSKKLATGAVMVVPGRAGIVRRSSGELAGERGCPAGPFCSDGPAKGADMREQRRAQTAARNRGVASDTKEPERLHMPRGSKPGTKRGGRKRGTPNRRTILADRICRRRGPSCGGVARAAFSADG